jgi:hypothetical protein
MNPSPQGLPVFFTGRFFGLTGMVVCKDCAGNHLALSGIDLTRQVEPFQPAVSALKVRQLYSLTIRAKLFTLFKSIDTIIRPRILLPIEVP